tara:strand:- start:2425 stop:3918 length:1494 start_codon:yes stop_codon:yes gene_type:complete
MSVVIQTKNNATGTPASLAVGELAVNTTDGKLFVGSAVGGVITISDNLLPLANTWTGLNTFTAGLNVTTGNVGIGTATPSYPLEVVGGSGVGVGPVLAMSADLGVTYDNAFFATASKLLVGRNWDDLGFRTGGTERVTIDSTGNVGIGTNNPRAALDVPAGALLGSPSDVWTNSYVTRGGNGFFYTHGAFETSIAHNGYRNTNGTWTSLGVNGNSAASISMREYIDFKVDASKATGTDPSVTTRMRLNGVGNLGIGTTTPISRLDVRGASNSLQARFGGLAGRGLEISTLFKNGVTDSGILFDAPITNSAYTFRSNGSDLMELASNGYVGVGTGTSMLYKFTVGPNNNAGLGWEGAGSSGTLYLSRNSGGNTWKMQAGFSAVSANLRIYYDNNLRGEFNSTTGAYTSSSDYRLKENVAPLTGALSQVALLKPSTFNWIETGEFTHGFIAHEVQEVLPFAVSGEKDAEETQGLDKGGIVPLLTAAIQELTARVEALEA